MKYRIRHRSRSDFSEYASFREMRWPDHAKTQPKMNYSNPTKLSDKPIPIEKILEQASLEFSKLYPNKKITIKSKFFD